MLFAELRGGDPVSKHQIQPGYRLTRDGTVESVSQDQILRCERVDFPWSADIEQDWQPYPVDPHSYCICDHTLYGPHAGVTFHEHIYG